MVLDWSQECTHRDLDQHSQGVTVGRVGEHDEYHVENESHGVESGSFYHGLNDRAVPCQVSASYFGNTKHNRESGNKSGGKI